MMRIVHATIAHVVVALAAPVHGRTGSLTILAMVAIEVFMRRRVEANQSVLARARVLILECWWVVVVVGGEEAHVPYTDTSDTHTKQKKERSKFSKPKIGEQTGKNTKFGMRVFACSSFHFWFREFNFSDEKNEKQFRLRFCKGESPGSKQSG